MAVSCGMCFTNIVTGTGAVWTSGTVVMPEVADGSLLPVLPVRVGGRETFEDEDVVMTAAGEEHIACVTAQGTVWTWGIAGNGRLGNPDLLSQQRPSKVDRKRFGGASAVMVACGREFTLVLTVLGSVWVCGGENDWWPIPKLVRGHDAQFGLARIVMVAAGCTHSVALGACGRVWTWGGNGLGQLGHNSRAQCVVPTLLAAFAADLVAHISAAGHHTMAVTTAGELWSWGWGDDGQLGLGDFGQERLVPTRVGGKGGFLSEPVRMACCGDTFSMAVTTTGLLWSWGDNDSGQLGHSNRTSCSVPTLVQPHLFGHAQVVKVSCGTHHTAAVTEEGVLYTWGGHRFGSHRIKGLGHAHNASALAPTIVEPCLLEEERVGCHHGIPPLHALAFAMGTHPRLGSGTGLAHTCVYNVTPHELVQRIVWSTKAFPRGR